MAQHMHIYTLSQPLSPSSLPSLPHSLGRYMYTLMLTRCVMRLGAALTLFPPLPSPLPGQWYMYTLMLTRCVMRLGCCSHPLPSPPLHSPWAVVHVHPDADQVCHEVGVLLSPSSLPSLPSPLPGQWYMYTLMLTRCVMRLGCCSHPLPSPPLHSPWAVVHVHPDADQVCHEVGVLLSPSSLPSLPSPLPGQWYMYTLMLTRCVMRLGCCSGWSLDSATVGCRCWHEWYILSSQSSGRCLL